MIPYGKQYLDQYDIRAVVRALRAEKITQGPQIELFERKLAQRCGARYAVAVSSGTAALHLATVALGLGPKDKVLTTPISFLATSNSILYVGARPVFCDVNPQTINIEPEEIEKHLTRDVKAIYPVHFGGMPCNMIAIHRIAKKHRLFVVEDACHALGAFYSKGRSMLPVGSCVHSDMAVFSFHPVKHITTGEGGAITTNSMKYYKKLLSLRSHGMYRSSALSKRIGPWYYAMKDLGFNYRLTDLQAALGISQLRKLDFFVKRRREIAARYSDAFKRLPHIKTPFEPSGYTSSYHLYPIRIDFAKLKITRASLMKALLEGGIGTQVHYIPIYTQPYYRKHVVAKPCLEAEGYYASALSLPLYPKMTDFDVKKVIRTFSRLIQKGFLHGKKK